jgi:hypothetical protein
MPNPLVSSPCAGVESDSTPTGETRNDPRQAGMTDNDQRIQTASHCHHLSPAPLHPLSSILNPLFFPYFRRSNTMLAMSNGIDFKELH